jgi:CheY-like chemotaxis protein/signal transduction histidine kinase
MLFSFVSCARKITARDREFLDKRNHGSASRLFRETPTRPPERFAPEARRPPSIAFVGADLLASVAIAKWAANFCAPVLAFQTVREIPAQRSFLVLFPTELCLPVARLVGHLSVVRFPGMSHRVLGLVAGVPVVTGVLSVALLGLLTGLGFSLRKVRRLEKQLLDLDAERQKISRLLKTASESRAEFLVHLGHEIRNPLSGIMGLTHAVEETSLTASQREFITAIRRCVTLLDSVLGGVLTGAAAEAKTLEAEASARAPGTGIQCSVTPAAHHRIGEIAGELPIEMKPRPPGDAATLSAGTPARSTSHDSWSSKTPAPSRLALVIEDIEYNAVATQAMLRVLGLNSEIVTDGAVALERLQSRPYDLVLVDWNLPGLTGTEVVARFRGWEARGQRQLIIGTSAYTTEADRQACLAAGMDAFVSKPLTPEKIAGALRAFPQWEEISLPDGRNLSSPDAAKAAGLDLQLLVFLSERSSGGLAAQIDRYLSAFDADRQAAHAAVASGDSRRIHQQAHRLIAHADAVRCEALAALAARLQSEAAAAGDDARRQLIVQIDDEFVALRNTLDSIRASTGPA